MEQPSWQVVEEVSGSGLAEMIRGLLEAQGIPVLVSQEGAGHFGYPVNVGRLGEVQILVPDDYVSQAKSILADYHSGLLADLQLKEDGSVVDVDDEYEDDDIEEDSDIIDDDQG